MYRPVLIALAVLIAGCSRETGRPDPTVPTAERQAFDQLKARAPFAAAARVAADPSPTMGDSAPSTPAEVSTSSDAPMIIKTGEATIEVDSLDRAVARVRDLAHTTGGYIANTSAATGDNNVRTATLELKVPVANFDNALTALPPIGRVETVTVTAQDVGEEYVDVQSHVANSRHLEQRLLDLLATRTGKLKDVLDVERELSRVRGDIDQSEGRLRYLHAHSSLSTLSITVHEPPPLLADRPGDHPLSTALHDAWHNFISLITVAIASLGILLPAALVAVALWLTLRRLRARQS
jgi:Domain of unknown function (DUF4349)